MIRKMNMEDADFVGGVAFCFVLDYNNGRNRKPCAGGKISGKGAERDGGAQ